MLPIAAAWFTVFDFLNRVKELARETMEKPRA